jgi:hypothetical protein
MNSFYFLLRGWKNEHKENFSPVNFDGERVSAERFDPENREEERSDKAHV